MKYPVYCAALAFTFIGTLGAQAEILAMANYESKPADALKAFKHPVAGLTRQEGIAIIDVDPASPNFKKIVETIPLPPDVVAKLDRLRRHVAVVEPVREYEAPLLGELLRASLDGAHLKVAYDSIRSGVSERVVFPSASTLLRASGTAPASTTKERRTSL